MAGLILARAEEADTTEAVETRLSVATEASDVSSNVPPEINEALRSSRDGMATSYLLDPDEVVKRSMVAECKERLTAARRLKQQHNYSDAEHLLEGILNEPAPEEFHRTALLDMALVIEAEGRSVRAQQVFSQYVAKYPEDPSVPEVLLRQGLLYRRMGAISLSLIKFYAVMSTAIKLKTDQMDYYERLVLQAQTEIAETYYLQGKHKDAVEFLTRLLKLDNPELNKPQILYKLIRSLSSLEKSEDVVLQSEIFLSQYPAASELPDVRYMYGKALQKLGRNTEAKQQVLALLESQHAKAASQPADWVYWQQRAGNEIANLLYLEGDYVDALEIYRTLADLSDVRDWQVPVWYQMGLIYERLEQPQKASELYQRILDGNKDDKAASDNPAIKTVLDMAQWRLGFLRWQAEAAGVADRLAAPQVDTQMAASPAS